jgi:hypothetical protein
MRQEIFDEYELSFLGRHQRSGVCITDEVPIVREVFVRAAMLNVGLPAMAVRFVTDE